MFERLRQQFSAGALVLSLIAIVLALAGGAFAASNASSSKSKAAKGPRGPKGPKGERGEKGEKGDSGAAGQNGANGTSGTNGTDGEDGLDGATVLNGSGAPSNSEGENGDFYIKTGSSPEIFGPKTAGAWGSGTKLKGSNGTPGTNGNTVLNGTGTPSNTEGEEGDFYIKTGASPEIFGPKTESGWGSGTSLKGPQGPEGNIKETLPPGVQMEGTWTAAPFSATGAGQPVFTNVSLNIPTESALSPIIMREGENQSPEFPIEPPFRECSGGVGDPTVVAPSNFITEGTTVLCMFTSKEVNWELERLEFTFGVTGLTAPPSPKMGIVLEGKSKAAGLSYAYGTWAVETIPAS